MPAPSPPLDALVLVLAAGAVAFLSLSRIRLKWRAVSKRRLGVRVCDFGADLDMTPRLRPQSYRIAFYVTMKSLPREVPEAGKAVSRITSNAA